MNDKKLDPICQPCVVEDLFVPQALEPVCKPCPAPNEDPNAHLYPTSTYIEVRDDCLRSMLVAMTTQKFCKVPPRGCK